MSQRIACLLFAGASLLPRLSVGQEGGVPEIVGVRVGFAGCYKVGLWTPVEVTVRGLSTAKPTMVHLIVPDGDGVPSRVSSPLPPQSESAMLYARFGRIESQLTVELESDGRIVARRVLQAADTGGANRFPPAIHATRKMILVVAAEPMGVQDAVDLLREQAGRRTVVTRLDDCGRLPTRWYGYEGVAAVVVSTSRPNRVRNEPLSDAQAAALDEWVHMGGTLLLSVGRRAEAVSAADCPLSRFLPGRLVKILTLRDTRAVETYAGSSTRVPPPADGGRPQLTAAQLTDVRGAIEAREADLPLVVRAARGFGQVVFIAADLDQEPLRGWTDRPLLVTELLGLPAGQIEEPEEIAPGLRHAFNDLSGQLRSALDRFDGVRAVPFWAVAALVFVYIVLIGPLDYLFLRKVAGRMRWTWVTFPGIVVAFTVAAYVLAYRLKGDRIRVNQVDLVDMETASGYARGTSWINVFSPRTEAFSFSLRPTFPDGLERSGAETLFSWLGLPGEALGGMDPRASAPVLWTQAYDFSPQLDGLRRVPIPIWSTKSFTARWHAPATVRLEAELAEEGGVPTGSITNRFQFPLSDCMLAYKIWAYDLETLRPNASVRIDSLTGRSELRTLLTGRKIVRWKDTYQQEATPYDRRSVDPAYVLRMMMFFRAAGGRRYTGLAHGYQEFVDLTDLLKTDRAVLVARVPSDRSGGELLRDGRPLSGREDWHLTFCRFVLPVAAGAEP